MLFVIAFFFTVLLKNLLLSQVERYVDILDSCLVDRPNGVLDTPICQVERPNVVLDPQKRHVVRPTGVHVLSCNVVRPIGVLYSPSLSFGAFFVSLVTSIVSIASLLFSSVVFTPSSFIYFLANCHSVGSRKADVPLVFLALVDVTLWWQLLVMGVFWCGRAGVSIFLFPQLDLLLHCFDSFPQLVLSFSWYNFGDDQPTFPASIYGKSPFCRCVKGWLCWGLLVVGQLVVVLLLSGVVGALKAWD